MLEESYIVKEFHDNKGLKYEISYLRTNEKKDEFLQKNGLSKYYHNNGQLFLEQFYKNDRKNGYRKWWSKDGILLYIELYKEDELTGVAKYFNYDNIFRKICSYKKNITHGIKLTFI